MKRSEIESRASFDLIRYAQGWEDADTLLSALQVESGDTCLSIAASGDNALSLVSRGPKKVIAVDLSESQLECVRLRIAAYSQLNHGELLELMGSRPSNRRRQLMEKCRPLLSKSSVDFWERRMGQVDQYGVAGTGKFESYFRILKNYIIPLVHSRRTVLDLFEKKSLEDRRIYFDRRWDSWRWRLLLGLFVSRRFMGRHGRDPEFLRYVEGGMGAHMRRRVEHAFVHLEPWENPYLQWILLGDHRFALPHALRPENFDPIRDNLNRIELRKQSVEDFASSGETATAWYLSDIFEYMSPESFQRLYGQIIDKSAPVGSRLAYWNMMVPRSVPEPFRDRIQSETSIAGDLYEQDKAFFYSRFVLERVVG